MRGGFALLIILASCRPPSGPDYIQDLLCQTPIPLDKLTDVLCLRKGDLQLMGDPAPDILDYPVAPRWTLKNISGRELWIHRGELAAWVYIQPLAPFPGGCGGVKHCSPPERPTFAETDWIQLPPGRSVPILIPAPYAFGLANISCSPGNVAEGILWRAHSFNQGAVEELPGPLPLRDSFSLGTTWILPDFSDEHRSSKGESWITGLPLRMTPLPDGSLRWTSLVPTSCERPDPLRVRAWGLTLDRNLAFEGDLVALRHETRRLSSNSLHVETDYRVPGPRVSGEHRILLLAPRMGVYVSTFDREPGMQWTAGISTWTPLLFP